MREKAWLQPALGQTFTNALLDTNNINKVGKHNNNILLCSLLSLLQQEQTQSIDGNSPNFTPFSFIFIYFLLQFLSNPFEIHFNKNLNTAEIYLFPGFILQSAAMLLQLHSISAV